MFKLLFLALSVSTQFNDTCENDRPYPVCGGDGRTYKNECYAELVGVEVAYAGECVRCEKCAGIHEPVCGNDGRTYINSCFADCKGLIVVHTGKCKPSCNCPKEVELVCGKDGKTYRNYSLTLKPDIDQFDSLSLSQIKKG